MEEGVGLGNLDFRELIGISSGLQFPLGKLVPPARFQRATFRLGGGRSMQLSYGSTWEINSLQMCR